MGYLVCGSGTIRFPGVAGTISSAVRSTGNQAYGFAAATAVIGAKSSPICVRYSSGAVPTCARRATSHRAKVVYAWKTSCAISAAGNGASNGKRLPPAPLCGPWRLPPAAFQRAPGAEPPPAAHAGYIEVAVHDCFGGVIDQHLRGRAADAGVVLVLRGDAEPLAQAAGRIVVLPRLAVDDLQ